MAISFNSVQLTLASECSGSRVTSVPVCAQGCSGLGRAHSSLPSLVTYQQTNAVSLVTLVEQSRELQSVPISAGSQGCGRRFAYPTGGCGRRFAYPTGVVQGDRGGGSGQSDCLGVNGL
jgi:hypothetical protein